MQLIGYLILFFGALSQSAYTQAQVSEKAQLMSFFSGQDALVITADARDGAKLVSLNANVTKTPASTLKLLTSLAALDRWGPDHRFETSFYVSDATLWVIGAGDPFIVSQDLPEMVNQLSKIIETPLEQIIIDGRAFVDESQPGFSKRSDPYNALPSAVAINFNTVNLKRSSLGWESAEPQTQLTPSAIRLANRLKAVEAWPQTTPKRVSWPTVRSAQTHFAELLRAQLSADYPSKVGAQIKITNIADASNSAQLTLPSHAQTFKYQSARPLSEMLSGALKYSNNFITNQLFLLLTRQTPKTFSHAQQEMNDWIKTRFTWRDVRVQDGSGLSRANRLSAEHLMEVLERLAPFKALLSTYQYEGVDAVAQAKTGTLTNVSTMAGYITANNRSYRFVFMFDRPMAYGARERVLRALLNYVGKHSQVSVS